MYFSTSLSSDRMSTSSTSLYDLSPVSTTSVSSHTSATCAYPSWPRRPSLSHTSSDASSAVSSPITFARPQEQANAFITDDELYPELDDIVPARYNTRELELPAVFSPVGSLPRCAGGVSLSSMSQREMIRRIRGEEAKVEAALAVARAQRRRLNSKGRKSAKSSTASSPA